MDDNIGESLEQLYLAEKACPMDPRLIVKITLDIGNKYQNLGQYSHALYYFERALDIQLLHYNYDIYNLYNVINSDSFEISNTLYYIESLHYKIGLFSSSLELAYMRLISYTILHPNIPDIIISDAMVNVGILYRELEEYDEALYYLYQAVNIRMRIYKLTDDNVPDHEQIVFYDILNFIEFASYKAGHYSEALDLCKDRFFLYQNQYGYLHKTVSDTLITISTLYDAMGNYQYAVFSLQEALFISNAIQDQDASHKINLILDEENRKFEHSEGPVKLNNNYSKFLRQLNDRQMISNNFYNYTSKDAKEDVNCFFRAAALSLEFPEYMHSLLQYKTTSYIKNNLDHFYEFSRKIDVEIDSISQERESPDNLSIQAFADAFRINIVLFYLYSDNFSTINPRSSNKEGTINLLHTVNKDRTISLLYTGKTYIPIFDYVINNNSKYNNQEYRDINSTSINSPIQDGELVNAKDQFNTRTIINESKISDDLNVAFINEFSVPRDSIFLENDFRMVFEEELYTSKLCEERLVGNADLNELMTLQSGEENNFGITSSVPKLVIEELGQVIHNSKLAAELISKYGEGLFDMNPKDLCKMEGIGKKRAQYIKELGEQYKKTKTNPQLEDKGEYISMDLSIKAVFSIKYDNLILNHPQLPLMLKIAKEKGGAILLMELMSFKDYKESEYLTAEEVVDYIIEQNFFLNNKRGNEFIQDVENYFDKDILLKILELGRDQEIAEQILTELETKGINEIIAMLLGKELEIIGTTDNLENIVHQDELNQLRITPNGLLNVWSNKAYQKISKYIDNLAKNLDDMLNMGQVGDKIAITITLLEEWLGVAVSGQKFIGRGIPSYYYPNNDDDWPSSGGGGSGSSYDDNTNSRSESNSNELIGLVFPLYNETGHQI